MIDVPSPTLLRPVLALTIVVATAAGCADDAAGRDAGTALERIPVAAESATPAPVAAEVQEKSDVNEPTRILISDIGVDAELVGVGLADDSSMETPAYDSNQAGWYTEGPRPGEAGPAVIAAHVDSSTGPDVFARLDELDPGDEIIVIDTDGERHAWAVNRVEQHDKDALPIDDIWPAIDYPALTLITCAGDYEVDEYADNLIVYTDHLEGP